MENTKLGEFRRNLQIGLVVTGSVFLVLACQQKKAAPAVVTSVMVQKQIINPRCMQCHTESGHAGGVVLTDIDQTMKKSAAKDAKKVIMAGCPEKSLLYMEVKSQDMPPSGPPLSDSDVNLIAGWIRAQGPACAPGSAEDDGDDDGE